MVTVLRHDGLRIVIYPNDHGPAHVHVFGDGEAKIDLNGPGGVPKLVSAVGMSRPEVRRAVGTVETHVELLRKRWKEIHG